MATDLVDAADDARDRRAREDLLQLLDEVARLGLATREAEQAECEKGERNEGEQREVGDHRRQVRPPVGEELREGCANMHCVSLWRRWTPRKRSPISPRSRRRSRRPSSWPPTAR